MNKLIYSIFVCTIYSLVIVAASADNSKSHTGSKKGNKLSKSTTSEVYTDSDSVVSTQQDSFTAGANLANSSKKTIVAEVVDSSHDAELLSIFKILKLQKYDDSEIANKYIFIFLDPFAPYDQEENLGAVLRQCFVDSDDCCFKTIGVSCAFLSSLKKTSALYDATKSFVDEKLVKAFVLLLKKNKFSKDKDKILLIGLGFGGCIASALIDKLSVSNPDLIGDCVLLYIATPVLFSTEEQEESFFGGTSKKDSLLFLGRAETDVLSEQSIFLPKKKGIKILNLYSSADTTQLSYKDIRRKIVFSPSTLAKLDIRILNMRVFVDTKEPSYQELCSTVISYLQELIEACEKFNFHSDFEVVIVQEKYYMLRSGSTDAISPIIMIVRWDVPMHTLFCFSEDEATARENGARVYKEFVKNKENSETLNRLYPGMNFHEQNRTSLVANGIKSFLGFSS